MNAFVHPTRGWHGVTQTPAGLRLTQDLRRDLGLTSPARANQEVTKSPAAAA
jgi:hypothetical protein